MAVDAEASRWTHALDVGVQCKALRVFVEHLQRDYDPDAWGLRPLGDVPDLVQRAHASDQIVGAADAILTNLVEARYHEMDFQALAGEGFKFGEPPEADVRMSMAIVGFFRGFGSAMDCLAGATVGVLRVNSAIPSVSMTRDLIKGLDPAKASTPDQSLLWQDFRDLLDAQRHGPPPGWLDWALQYRNGVMHRPRQINMMLPRPPKTSIVLPPGKGHLTWRFDLHLRRRPWLPELQHLAEPGANVVDLLLAEPATTTLRGLMVRLQEFVERAAERLDAQWTCIRDGKVTLPSEMSKWKPVVEANTSFDGFAPTPPPTGPSLMVHPLTGIRLVLAQRLLELDKR